jgi:polygalacturonase
VLTAAGLLIAASPVKAAADKTIGVVGNGETLNTTTIQEAINDCATSGGGIVRFPAGCDVTMDDVIVPIAIRLGSRLKTFREGDQPKSTAGKLADVTIRNVSAKNVGMIGILINGVLDHPVEELTMENIQMELPGGATAQDAKVNLPEKEAAYPEFDMFGKTMPAAGIYARHVSGMKLDNVRMSLLRRDARPLTVFIDVKDATPADPG